MANAKSYFHARKGGHGGAGSADGDDRGSDITGDDRGQTPEPRKRVYPSHSRLLRLKHEANRVGENQQKTRAVRGEKYGHFQVVNDAFFGCGPKASSYI